MGCFAFDCAECGSHEQEGIVRGCVVRVDGAWVRGEYSEYGWVGCAREGQGDQEVQVWLEQFQSDYFESWGVAADALMGTAIYCADPRRSCVPAGLRVRHALPARAAVAPPAAVTPAAVTRLYPRRLRQTQVTSATVCLW